MDTKLITWAAVIAITISSSSADEVEKAPVKESEGEFIPVVTRKLQGDVILAWISAMHNKLPMTQRQVGPFGLLQDPNQKVAVRKTKIVSSSGFLNAIKAMEINFVNSVDVKNTRLRSLLLKDHISFLKTLTTGSALKRI